MDTSSEERIDEQDEIILIGTKQTVVEEQTNPTKNESINTANQNNQSTWVSSLTMSVLGMGLLLSEKR